MNRHLLKAIRLRHHLSLTALASRLGVTLDHLTRMESGKAEIPPKVEAYMKGLSDD